MSYADLSQNLIEPREEDTVDISHEQLYEHFPKEAVDKVLSIVNYKDFEEMPKNEDPNYPILYVFRHGQTQDNARQIFSGWRDIELTEQGIEEAEILADKLADKEIQMLIASDQKRAIDTMKIAIAKNKTARDLEIIKEKRLRERHYGKPTGHDKAYWKLQNPELTNEYRRSWDHNPPEGESLEMVCERVQEFLDEIIPLMKEQKINVAISCHGNSIRGIRKYFEKLTPEETTQIETPLGQDYAAYSIK
jgi:2,3-bisphosphoglycerate-dependent phosphoglycerate mutase